MRTNARSIGLGILAAIGAAVVVIFASAFSSALHQDTTKPVTLSFDCSVSPDDSYTLAITNNNPAPVTASEIDVAFLGANGNQMGQDTPGGLVIAANSTYEYQGSYFQFQLGGVPSACEEIQWQQG